MRSWVLLLLLATSCRASITLEARAEQLTARAAVHEPDVTPILVGLTERLGGEMIKLEHRLKTLGSTVRKLNKIHLEKPDVAIVDLDLDDTIRYTVRFEDEPAGHHVDSIREVLAALQKSGHSVVRLKNYWPKDDNYSGVNGIMRHPAGFEWELQFHTLASLSAQAETRDMYEELRKVDTSIDRKRELFDLMTRVWAAVPIPDRILEPKSLHDREEIRDRKRP